MSEVVYAAAQKFPHPATFDHCLTALSMSLGVFAGYFKGPLDLAGGA